ncbi:MAG: radical SAM protein [Proteobacteria bacterium]|nr:radical SAM protein [Pseudomonadota bacterium]
MKQSTSSPELLILSCPPRAVHYPPADSAHLQSVLKEKGFEVETYDVNLALFRRAKPEQRMFWHEINNYHWHEKTRQGGPLPILNRHLTFLAAQIKKRTPRAIYIDFTYPNEIFACRLIAEITRITESLMVLAGGPSTHTEEQRHSLEQESGKGISHFLSAPTELSLLSFLTSSGKGNRDGRTEKKDIEASPMGQSSSPENDFPLYEGVQLDSYRNSLAMHLATGCPNGGLYCPEKRAFPSYWEKPLQSILAELEYYTDRLNVKNFYFHASPVNNHGQLEEICDEIVKRFPDIRWAAELVPWMVVPAELFVRMRAAGCHTLGFCAISGSDRILDDYFSGAKAATIELNLLLARQAGIRTVVRFLVGFPDESFKDFSETSQFLEKNLANISQVLSVIPYAPRPGTTLAHMAEEKGIRLEDPIAVNEWHSDTGNTFVLRKRRIKELVRQAKHAGKECGNTLLGQPWEVSRLEAWRMRFFDPQQFANEPWHPRGLTFTARHIRSLVMSVVPACEIEESDILALQGVEDGRRALSGPEVVHLDLTNRCNLNCIGCWDRSPLVRSDDGVSSLSETLSYEMVTGLIDDLMDLGGMQSLKLSGGGEPAMHPRFIDILRYIRSRNRFVEIDINTNGTLLTEKFIETLVLAEINLLTVSLWAATPETYVFTHPNQSEKTFQKIVDLLKAIVKRRKNGPPRIFVHNVLMNCNYHEMEEMLRLALDIGADEVHFTLVDTVPGKTESLLLTEEQHGLLKKSCARIRRDVDQYNEYSESATGRRIRVTNFHEFCDKLMQSDVEKGVYDHKALNAIPCYIGWLYTRIMADGRVVPCCKGHRLGMGNLHKDDFKRIWNSPAYCQFRNNGRFMDKSAAYFSVMSDDNSGVPGCVNCDNVMHNTVMHDKFLFSTRLFSWVSFKLSQWRVLKK